MKKKMIDGVAARIVKLLRRVRSAWVHLMERLVAGKSKMTLQVSVVLFSMLTSICCGWIMLRTFDQARRSSIGLEALKGSIRARIMADTTQRAAINSSVVADIRLYKQYVDSLSSDGPGRKIADSLQLMHPGLLDSIRLLETNLSQSK